MAYTFEQVVQAANNAHRAGDLDARNELLTLADELKTKEREDFVSYEPMKAKDFGEGIADDLGDIGRTLAGSKQWADEKYASGEITSQAMPAAMLTKGAIPAAKQVINVGLDVAGQGLSMMTPDSVEDWTVEAARGVAYDISETPVFKKAAEYAGMGYDKYLQWKNTLSAADQVALEGSIDMAVMASPAKTRGPAETPTNLERWGWSKQNAGKQQSYENRIQSVQDMLAADSLKPKDMATAEFKGPLRRITATPSPLEEEVIKVVSSIRGVNPNKNFLDNAHVVRKEIEVTAERLVKQLKRTGNPKIDKASLINSLETQLEEYLGSNEAIAAMAKPKKVTAFLNMAIDSIKQSDGTAIGVLEARKALDAKIKSMEGYDASLLDAEYLASKNTSIKIIRDTLNNSVDNVSSDVDVKKLLRKQFLMYNAKDVLETKAANLAATSLGRAYANVVRALPLSMPKTLLSAGALGGVALNAMGSPVLGFLAGGASVAAGTVMAQRVLSGPAPKKAIGALLVSMGKAIKTTKNKEMLKQLRADRAVLISILAQPTPEDEQIPMKGAAN